MATDAPTLPPAPSASDPLRQRARSRRTLLLLVGVVALLALFTVGYVLLFPELRDPDQPPSVLAHNPRVQLFEIALASVAVLVLGFGLLRLVKRRP